MSKHLTTLVAGFLIVASYAKAGIIVQPPSEFDITTDGVFTTPEEWSDVEPAIRLDATAFVYTATDPGQGALYLMYDMVESLTPLGPGDIAGPVHFHNSGSLFEVFFSAGGGLLVLKDGVAFDTSDPQGGEDSFSGAIGFAPSPNSATPHNMFELEVLFNAGMPNGHNHGQYSPDPSHWGADLPREPGPEPECILQPEPIECDPIVIPPGDPVPVKCPPFPPQGPSDIRFVFGEASSSACVDVDLDGTVTIETIPIPGEGGDTPAVSEWGLMVMTVLMFTVATVVIGRRRRAPSSAATN